MHSVWLDCPWTGHVTLPCQMWGFAWACLVLKLKHVQFRICLLNRRSTIFVKVHYLDQEAVKGPFWSLSLSASCYYQSNHSKGRGNPVKCLAQGRNKHTCCLSLHYSFFMLNQRCAGAGIQESIPAGVGVFQQEPDQEWILSVGTRPRAGVIFNHSALCLFALYAICDRS